MDTVYDRIAESFAGASKELDTIYPERSPPTTRFPFAKYFEDQFPRERRFGEEEEEEVKKPPPPPFPPRGIDYTVRPPSLPAGYGQAATVNIMPDWEFVGTELKLRSDDYLIMYQGKKAGKVKRDTGAFEMDDPGFWWKAWVPSVMDRLYLSQSGQVPKEAFSKTPLKVSQEFADWLYTPQPGDKASPATTLSIIGLIGTLGITGYQAVQGVYYTAMTASVQRNLRSWAKTAKVTIPKETEFFFTRQAVGQLSKKFMAKEAIKTLFRPTKTGFGLTDSGIKAAETSAHDIVRQSPLLLGIAGNPRTAMVLNNATSAIVRQNLSAPQITAAFIAGFVPPGVVLEKTPSLTIQLKELGHTEETIAAMRPEEAWANLFKASPVAAPAPAAPTVMPKAEVVPPGLSKKIALAHNTTGGGSFDIQGRDLVGMDAFAVGVHTDRAVFLPTEKVTEAAVSDFVSKNADLFSQPQYVIGTWFDKEIGKSVLVVSTLSPDIESAMNLARQEGQKEVFNLKTQQRISIPIVSKFAEINRFEFTRAISKAPRQPFLTRYTVDELNRFRLFLSEDKLVGFAIKPDGDMVNVFNASGARGAGQEAVVQAIVQGATKLDAMGVGFLKEYYEDAGFVVVRREPWNAKYAPKEWDYKKYGKPDIIYMEYPKEGSRNAADIRTMFTAARVRHLAAFRRGQVPPAPLITEIGSPGRGAVPLPVQEPPAGRVRPPAEPVVPPEVAQVVAGDYLSLRENLRELRTAIIGFKDAREMEALSNLFRTFLRPPESEIQFRTVPATTLERVDLRIREALREPVDRIPLVLDAAIAEVEQEMRQIGLELPPAPPAAPPTAPPITPPPAVPPPPTAPPAAPPAEIAPSIPEATAGTEVELEASGSLLGNPIREDQLTTILNLGKQKLIVSEANKPKPQLTHLMRGLTGKNKIGKLTEAEADYLIKGLNALEVKYGKPPRIPTTTGLITKDFADKIPHLKEIGILEKVRPTRHVFEKMGLRQEVWKPAFEAEVKVYEEHQAFDKALNSVGKLVGKDPARRSLVFRELENPGSQVGLTANEKTAVTWFRKYFDDWADRLKLPENKRRTNYVTHVFEEEISRGLKAKHPLDPELIKALDFITPKTVFNPYLQQRLGQKIGLKEDPFAAAKAYEARALKVFYYEPLIQKIRVYEKYLPPSSAKYLKGFITRITDRPLTIDRELNRTIEEAASKIKGLPGGEAFANSLARGNPGGMVSYNLTSVLYTLWLGYKPTSAIRNLGQHSLIIAETGPVNFAKGIGLRLTTEGKAALKESLVLRSRRGAFIPGVDSSFASKWNDAFREKALWMFRFADKQNVSDAFLAGYAEAKGLFPNAPRQLWLARGDEVAADTQYLYTKFNSFQMSQNSIGRVFSMLTTWTENWMELMTKWISTRPSQVYLAYTKETGQAMPKKNWSQTRKAILTYMAIVGLGYVIKEKTRLKAWEYTGLTSLSYLADIVGGDFPALQAPGAVADLTVGLVTDDERRLKTGWNSLKSTFIPSIVKQSNYVASGERDWLTLLLYMKGKDFYINKLEKQWEKEYNNYEVYENLLKEDGSIDTAARTKYRQTHPGIDARLFISGRFTTLKTHTAKLAVLKLIKEHNLDTELIRGYENVFGLEAKPVTGVAPPTPPLYRTEGEIPEAVAKWQEVRPSLNTTMLRGLDRLWYQGGSLMPHEEKMLREVHQIHSFKEKNFNAWVKQTLRQIFENAMREVNK